MPSFSTCLTHFISKYFAKKRGNLLIKGKPSYHLFAQLIFFSTNQILCLCHGGIEMDYFEFDFGNTFTNQVISKVLTPKINDFFLKYLMLYNIVCLNLNNSV